MIPLPATHPDAQEYNRDPVQFKNKLFRRLRDTYSSPYNDQTDDVLNAVEKLETALRENFSADQLDEKIKQAASITEQTYRGSVSKFIVAGFWRRNFRATTHITAAKASEPYEGPMPTRP